MDGMGWDGSPGGPKYRAPTVLKTNITEVQRITMVSASHKRDPHRDSAHPDIIA